MTRFTALLRLLRDADELATLRERLCAAEVIAESQGAYIADLQARLEEAHAECVRLGRLLHPSRGTE